MRLLVLTDSFPPMHSGGYELRCLDVLRNLHNNGFIVKVLTTKGEKNISSTESFEIKRELSVDNYKNSLSSRIINDNKTINIIRHEIECFKPDIVYLWHIINLSKCIMPFLATVKVSIVFDEGGKGLYGAWVQKGAWFSFSERLEKKIENKIILELLFFSFSIFSKGNLSQNRYWPNNIHAYFNGSFSRRWSSQWHIPLKRIETIPSGINLDDFPFKRRSSIGETLKVLIPGRISEIKGQIEALRLLKKMENSGFVLETVFIGKVIDNNYRNELMSLIMELEIESKITFLPMVAHDSLYKFYHDCDLCFFSSKQEMGFSRIPIESMATGCLLISWGLEGSMEIINKSNACFLADSSDDYQVLMNLLVQLKNDAGKYKMITEMARKYVEKNHSMDFYIQQIEKFLLDVKIIDES